MPHQENLLRASGSGAEPNLEVLQEWVLRESNHSGHETGAGGRKLRLGAYGDPMALPIGLIRKLTSFATGHTGYTHSWRLPWSKPYRKFIMASVESESAAAHAHAKGFRTFRVRRDDQPVMPTEIICPASDEAGHKRTCETCLACDGRRRDGQRSVTIIIHGGLQVQSDPRKAFDAIAS